MKIKSEPRLEKKNSQTQVRFQVHFRWLSNFLSGKTHLSVKCDFKWTSEFRTPFWTSQVRFEVHLKTDLYPAQVKISFIKFERKSQVNLSLKWTWFTIFFWARNLKCTWVTIFFWARNLKWTWFKFTLKSISLENFLKSWLAQPQTV